MVGEDELLGSPPRYSRSIAIHSNSPFRSGFSSGNQAAASAGSRPGMTLFTIDLDRRRLRRAQTEKVWRPERDQVRADRPGSRGG